MADETIALVGQECLAFSLSDERKDVSCGLEACNRNPEL